MNLLYQWTIKWANILGLSDWDIDIKLVPEGGITGYDNNEWPGGCDWVCENKQITISLARAEEHLLLHELVHVKFELTSLLIQYLPEASKLALTLAEDSIVTVMTQVLLDMDKKREIRNGPIQGKQPNIRVVEGIDQERDTEDSRGNV